MAILGSITIRLFTPNSDNSYNCDNVVVAQGDTGIYHNWWICTNYWPKNSYGVDRDKPYRNRIKCVNYSDKSDVIEFEILRLTPSNSNSFRLRKISRTR